MLRIHKTTVSSKIRRCSNVPNVWYKSSTLLTLFKIDFFTTVTDGPKRVLSFSFGRHDELCENLMMSQVFSLLLKSIKRYRTQSAGYRAWRSALCEVSRKTHFKTFSPSSLGLPVYLSPHCRSHFLLFPVNVTEQYMNRPNDTRTTLMSTLVYFWIDFLVKVVLSQQVKLAVFFSDAVSAYKLKLFQRKLVEFILHLPYIGLLQLWDGLFSGRFLLARFPQVRLLACSSSQRQSKCKSLRRFHWFV